MNKLSTRIAALTGPCRTIDAEILVQCCGYTKAENTSIIIKDGKLYHPNGRRKGLPVYPALTSSLDAITELIEKDLPELNTTSQQNKNGWGVRLINSDDRAVANVIHDTEVLARCLAFSKAMEANNETDS